MILKIWEMNPSMSRITKIGFTLLLFLQTDFCFAYQNLPSVQVVLQGLPYQLEIADTVGRKKCGLMYRKTLAKDAGMLFVYSHSGDHRIWMKNTLIPLTVIWLDAQARIINIKKLKPCRQSNCPSYSSDRPSSYILELHHEAEGRFNLGESLPAILNLP